MLSKTANFSILTKEIIYSYRIAFDGKTVAKRCSVHPSLIVIFSCALSEPAGANCEGLWHAAVLRSSARIAVLKIYVGRRRESDVWVL